MEAIKVALTRTYEGGGMEPVILSPEKAPRLPTLSAAWRTLLDARNTLGAGRVLAELGPCADAAGGC